MTAIDDRIAACEAADDAEEALRERVARAIHDTELCDTWPCDYADRYREKADAAIAVITTPALDPAPPDGDAS